MFVLISEMYKSEVNVIKSHNNILILVNIEGHLSEM
jgi:hypothetical protein